MNKATSSNMQTEPRPELAPKMNEEQLLSYLSDYLRSIPKEGTKVITLIGGPASGKGILAKKMATILGRTAVLSTDNYLVGDRNYRRTNIEDPGLSPLKKYDFDFLKKQIEDIMKLQDGEEIRIPIYDGHTGIAISQDPNNKPDPSTYPEEIQGRQDFIIVEGDFQELPEEIIDKLIYLHVNDKTRRENRLHRDSAKRNADVDSINKNFDSRQKTQFIPFTLPQKDKAHLVIEVDPQPLEQPTPETKFLYTYTVQEQKAA
ncbi:MAG: hypothetical protein M1308_19695 [Actinobacteria bacterium]|nr:hypothetical protein [Actinomycetota bacterium]